MPKDKEKHFWIALPITYISVAVAYLVMVWQGWFIQEPFTPKHNIYSGLFGLAVISILIICKEVYDCNKPKPTGFDFRDIAVGYFGAFTGVTFFYATLYLIYN